MTTPDPVPATDYLPDELLMRYWLGTVSAIERERVEQWFAKHPGYREQSQELHAVLKAGEWTPLSPEVVTARTVNILRESRVFADISGNVTTKNPPKSTHWRATWIGAALAGIALIATWTYQHLQQAPQPTMMTYTTGNGERATVTLPDGSIVRLNVASQLLVPSDYEAGNRSLRLNGEAMFTVAHRSKTPFTVSAGSSTTRVLGTTFVVRYYENTDTVATVAVRDGKVAVGSTVLTALQQVSVNDGKAGQIRSVDQRSFDFVDDVLVLESMWLTDAIPELNRWYNADIRIGDERLRERRIFGGFKAGSITDLIAILEMTYDVRVVRQGRVITLYTRG
jgi:transmembrane sensor